MRVLFFLLLPAICLAQTSHLVVSQVFHSLGSGDYYAASFVVIFNSGNQNEQLDGLSVQALNLDNVWTQLLSQEH
jgi:hypothetical protein